MLVLGYCNICEKFKDNKIFDKNICEDCLVKFKGVKND